MDYALTHAAVSFAASSVFWKAAAIFFADWSGYALIAFVAILFLQKLKKHLPVIFQLGAATILSRGIVTSLIRFFWKRQRPFLVDQNLSFFSAHDVSPSFPSGHASFFFAVAAVLYFYNRKLGIFAFAVSILMGVARVFAGYHWPSDIIGGALIGIASGAAVVLFFRKFYVQKF